MVLGLNLHEACGKSVCFQFCHKKAEGKYTIKVWFIPILYFFSFLALWTVNGHRVPKTVCGQVSSLLQWFHQDTADLKTRCCNLNDYNDNHIPAIRCHPEENGFYSKFLSCVDSGSFSFGLLTRISVNLFWNNVWNCYTNKSELNWTDFIYHVQPDKADKKHCCRIIK